MSDATDPPTAHLLERAAKGDRAAEDVLVGRLGSELHVLAEQHLRRVAPGGTLQPTALVNEAWMKCGRRDDLDFENRKAFLAFASRVMRNHLIDRARANKAAKRGGAGHRVSLHEDIAETPGADFELLDVEAALQQLEHEDAETARLVELRFYGGLTHPEIAEIMGWSLRTVERRWQFARAWLLTTLADEDSPDGA